tara:strand:+ start:67 stop:876 length:810 start_codon:yes stop_codon:yes gene_type:complete
MRVASLVLRSRPAAARCWLLASRPLCAPASPPPSDKGQGPSLAERVLSKAQSGAAQRFADVRERGGSFREATSEMLAKQQEDQKEQSFEDFAGKLVQLPKYDMAEFAQHLQESMDMFNNQGYVNKARLKMDTLRGGGTEQMLENVKARTQEQLAVVEAMTPSERSRPGLIGYEERERIVQALGLASHEPIKKLLSQYEMVQMQHEWCHREVAAGRELPQTNDEMQWRMRIQPTAQLHKLMVGHSKKMATAKQRRMRPLYSGQRRRSRGK